MTMEDTPTRGLYDPLIAKLVASATGIFVVVAVVRFLNRALSRALRDTDTRYRAQNFVTFLGYVVAFLVVGAVLTATGWSSRRGTWWTTSAAEPLRTRFSPIC